MRQLFAFLVLAVLFAACNGNAGGETAYKAVLTAHKWKYDIPAILEEVKNATDLNGGQKQMIPSILQRFDETTFLFMEDGRLIVERPDADIEGTWELDENAQTLKLDLSSAVSNPEKIKLISPERIILEKNVEKGSLYSRNFIPAIE